MLIKFIRRSFSVSSTKVFLEILIESKPEGVLTFELNSDVLPKTCENFKQLCEGSSNVLTPTGKKLTYTGSKIHRIVPGFLCQGGDITKLNGKGGWSIYGETFPDENFNIKHSSAGILSMANQGPNTNSSQFFITFAPCPVLDGKHIAFGKLIEGKEVLDKIEALGTASGKMRLKVTIGQCGVVVDKIN